MCELLTSCDVQRRDLVIADECFYIPRRLITLLLPIDESSKFAVFFDIFDWNKNSYERHCSITMIAEFYHNTRAMLSLSQWTSRCNSVAISKAKGGWGARIRTKDVLPIVQANCQTCHRPAGYNISGLVAPMSFMNYEETRPWARAIARKVESREMPPWFASEPKGVFENERGLTDTEIDTILSWVESGAPAGDQADAPPTPVFAETTNDGWSHGTPDFVIKMREPYVMADDAYDVNISFDTPLTEDLLPEDVWVRG